MSPKSWSLRQFLTFCNADRFLLLSGQSVKKTGEGLLAGIARYHWKGGHSLPRTPFDAAVDPWARHTPLGCHSVLPAPAPTTSSPLTSSQSLVTSHRMLPSVSVLSLVPFSLLSLSKFCSLSAQFLCLLTQAAFLDWTQMMHSFSPKPRALFCSLHITHLSLSPTPTPSLSTKASQESRPVLEATHTPWASHFTSLSSTVLICKSR